MDRFVNGTINDLRIWRGVYESSLFGPGARQRRDERAKLETLLRKHSVVQAKRSPKLPIVYQHTQKIRHKVIHDYFPCSSARTPIPPLTPKVESLQGRKHIATTPSHEPTSGETTASISFPSLPRTPYGTFLLRRPTTGSQPRPLAEEDDIFQNFANRLDLTPLLIDDSPAKTLKFYAEHYPLLLHKLLEEDKDKYVDRRSVTPSLGPDGRKRGAELGKRLLILNEALDELDKQTTDGRFYTELRDTTFDPRKWTWNVSRYI